ncbi:hypothetical protein HK098_004152 [Nowakowskiella sp. JEL0407]|nr:hypothetical protein HK098_004152 [Nowakowskiella sp. JEL0407]
MTNLENTLQILASDVKTNLRATQEKTNHLEISDGFLMDLSEKLLDAVGFYDLIENAWTNGNTHGVINAKRLKHSGGHYYVLNRGIVVSKHADVSKVMMGSQKRAAILNSFFIEVPKAMSSYAPILISNPTDSHTLMRKLLVTGSVGTDATKERLKNPSNYLRPILNDWLARDGDPLKFPIIAPVVFRCIHMLLFGVDAGEEVLKQIDEYVKYMPTILLPTYFHTVTAGHYSKKLSNITKTISKALPLRTNEDFIKLSAEYGVNSEDSCETVVDLILFAGVLGTSVLSLNGCLRIREDHDKRVALLRQNPSNFIYESARLDPPVQFITTISTEPILATFNGKTVEIPEGTSLIWDIVHSNKDPEFWGEDAEEFNISRDYSELHTWNGLLNVGPRACPGFDFSFNLVKEIVSAYSGTVSYTITVHTGPSEEADSVSNVYAKIEGSLGTTNVLSFPKNTKHGRNKSHSHTFTSEVDVGEIICVNLWRKEENLINFSNLSPNWFVDTVEIEKYGVNISERVVLPYFGWILHTPTAIFAGNASIIVPEEENTRKSKLRKEFLKKRQDEYTYVTFHNELGDWGHTLPATVKLTDDHKIPFPDRPLKEQTDDFDTVTTDSLLNAGIKSIFRPKGKSLTEYIKNTTLPNLFHRKGDHRIPPNPDWEKDEYFARMMIAGMNPVELKVVSKIPDNFQVTDEMLPGGRSLDNELKAGHLFMIDNDFVVPLVGTYHVDDETRYLYAPFVLFFADADSRIDLTPIAIQIEREIGSLVFTPKDSKWDWMAAKTYVMNTYFQTHQFRSHALWCHLLQEPVAIALNRTLPPCHPIFKLLHPHYYGLMDINSKARGSLIAQRQGIMSQFAKQGDVTSVGAEGNIKIAQAGYKGTRFDDSFFLNHLKHTGILESKAFKDHPYRDDGLLLFNAVETYVKKVIDIFYASDKDVARDTELQSWAVDLMTKGGVVGFPGDGKIESKSTLTYICSNLIFTASAVHGAVNFSQIVFGGNVASIPGAVYAPAPKEKGLTEQDLLNILPPANVALVQVAILNVLSKNSGDKLGYLREKLFVEDEVLKAQEEWRKQLQEVEKIINERNLLRAEPYHGFLPSETPNSTAI